MSEWYIQKQSLFIVGIIRHTSLRDLEKLYFLFLTSVCVYQFIDVLREFYYFELVSR